MPRPIRVQWSRVLQAVALLLVIPIATGRAQGTTAMIEGRVTDATSLRALENVQVTIDGTQLGALSNAQGGYRITGIAVPAGTATVLLRVRAIG